MSDLNQTPSEIAVLSRRGYKLTKKLGDGTYAKVYLAEYKPQNDTEKNNTLACKVIDASKATEDVKKFLPRELDILAKLNHPHVVHVHSIFQRRSKYFIFMRFAENGDLLDHVLKNGVVPESQARVWFRQLALGLQYLHEMEIVHRDIKCENVLITSNYNVKLADFGFARYVVDSRGKRVLSDTYCGSLSYVAPEILRGAPYNPKISDLWSLGVILYIILNKATPFVDTNPIKTIYELQMNRRWKFRSKYVHVLSENVKKLVTHLLEPDVNKRWRIDQIIYSDWIAMDPRLLVLTPAEQAALNSAIEERKKYKDKLAKRELRGSRGENKKGSELSRGADEIADASGEVTILKDTTKFAPSAIVATENQFKKLEM